MIEKYDIPQPNSLDSMEGVEFSESIVPFGDDTIKKIREATEYVGEVDDSIESDKKQAYALLQIGYFLNKDRNAELYTKSVLASLGASIQAIRKTENVEDANEIVGHYLIKSIYNAIELEELKSKEDIVKLAELVAQIYEGWGGCGRARGIYKSIDPVRFREKIDELSDMPDNFREGQVCGYVRREDGVMVAQKFKRKELDVNLVKEYINSLSMQEIESIEPIDLLKQLEEIANR